MIWLATTSSIGTTILFTVQILVPEFLLPNPGHTPELNSITLKFNGWNARGEIPMYTNLGFLFKKVYNRMNE